jgi:hypothetical protein
MADDTHLPGGVVHELPKDLEDSLKLQPEALATWMDITPLARNEWICWIESAKKEETRSKRIDWGCSNLTEGKAARVAGQGALTRERQRSKRVSDVALTILVSIEAARTGNLPP